MKFTIDEKFICNEDIIKEWGLYDDIPRDQLTPEQLIKIIKGEDRYKSHTVQDHPEFTKLRDELEKLGFIKTVRSYWNGDTVLKPFQLNEWKFEKGHRFTSACAMRVSIECARKYGWKSISSL